MTIKRLDHISVVVEDLASAVDFFTTLGMTRAGEMPVEGQWVDRVNAIENVQVDIVMMGTPDGHGRLELTKFRNPKLVEIEPAIAPPNALGLRSVMFAVESVDETVARLSECGGELIGDASRPRSSAPMEFARETASLRSRLDRPIQRDRAGCRVASQKSGGALIGYASRPRSSARKEPARDRSLRSRRRRQSMIGVDAWSVTVCP